MSDSMDMFQETMSFCRDYLKEREADFDEALSKELGPGSLVFKLEVAGAMRTCMYAYDGDSHLHLYVRLEPLPDEEARDRFRVALDKLGMSGEVGPSADGYEYWRMGSVFVEDHLDLTLDLLFGYAEGEVPGVENVLLLASCVMNREEILDHASRTGFARGRA